MNRICSTPAHGLPSVSRQAELTSSQRGPPNTQYASGTPVMGYSIYPTNGVLRVGSQLHIKRRVPQSSLNGSLDLSNLEAGVPPSHAEPDLETPTEQLLMSW